VKPRGASQRGASAIELVILVPVLLLFLFLVVAGGRLTTSQAGVDSAAHAAARAASLARSPAQAQADAERVAASVLGQHGVTCRSLRVQLDTSAFRPGGWVVADVRCDVDLRDVALLQLPGTRTLSSHQVSTIDLLRGTG